MVWEGPARDWLESYSSFQGGLGRGRLRVRPFQAGRAVNQEARVGRITDVYVDITER